MRRLQNRQNEISTYLVSNCPFIFSFFYSPSREQLIRYNADPRTAEGAGARPHRRRESQSTNYHTTVTHETKPSANAPSTLSTGRNALINTAAGGWRLAGVGGGRWWRAGGSGGSLRRQIKLFVCATRTFFFSQGTSMEEKCFLFSGKLFVTFRSDQVVPHLWRIWVLIAARTHTHAHFI